MSRKMSGKMNRKMSRKQIVMIEWAILILVFAGLLILGALFISSRLKKHGDKAQGSQNSVSNEQKNQAEPVNEDGSGTDGQESPGSLNSSSSSDDNNSSGSLLPPSADAKEEGVADETDSRETEPLTDAAVPDPVQTFTLSFAGDCTIGSLTEWQGSVDGDFQSVVADNYSYPLSSVKPIFEKDDFTMVNLEGTFTNSTEAVYKPYRFRADPVYVNVLSEGSVEAVATANNHFGDFYESGKADTLAALDSVGIVYAQEQKPLITSLNDLLKIGVVTYNTVEKEFNPDLWHSAVKTDIDLCKSEGCDLIIGFMHWGTVEYLAEPEDWEVQLAHDMADYGCDLIVGGHAHILQRMEYYNDVPIFYSMGNFCYGGHTNPEDKDTVIVQAEYNYDRENNSVNRTKINVIPCQVSSRQDKNDYCPVPCEEGSEAYRRIIERLNFDPS